MNCNNYNTIKVTAGNAFSLLLPLKEKQYISEQPIEEVINAALLTDVQVLLNGEEWNEYELGEDGVLMHFPSTLPKGVYNIELTAKYNGVAIRAAYFQCLSIVAWSYQSNAENYIPTSPIVADAAFIITSSDEELAALKEQYRDAIAATEVAKAEYEERIDTLNAIDGLQAVVDSASAYSEGKPALADAITNKGIPTSETDSLSQMADNILQISQDTYILDGGEMYAKQLFGNTETPCFWNLYEVMTELLSNGAYVNYGGILLAEYYKGYDTLVLEGAGSGGGYVTSDGVYYTEDITHIWNDANDGRGNRWVAYLFAGEEHDFQITNTDTSPRSIHIGRSVGTITSLVNGRVSEIVVTGGNSLKCFNSANYTQNFGKNLILRNLVLQNGTIYASSTTESLYIQAQTIQTSYSAPLFRSQNSLYSIILRVDNFTGYLFDYGNYRFTGMRLLSIYCGSTEIRSSIILQRENQQPSAAGLRKLDVIGENLVFYNSPDRDSYLSLSVFIGYISNNKRYSVDFAQSYTNGWKDVQSVEIQEGWCKPLNISPFIALSEATIYSNILQHLMQDEAGCGDGVTITLGATNLAKLTSDESVALLDSLTNTYGYTFA